MRSIAFASTACALLAACAPVQRDAIAPVVSPMTVATFAPVPSGTPASGAAVIVVPTFAPVLCSPPSALVAVGGTLIVVCSAADYGARFITSVADPTIASVAPSNASTATFYSITGLRAGTTSVTFTTQSGASTSEPVTVVGS